MSLFSSAAISSATVPADCRNLASVGKSDSFRRSARYISPNEARTPYLPPLRHEREALFKKKGARFSAYFAVPQRNRLT